MPNNSYISNWQKQPPQKFYKIFLEYSPESTCVGVSFIKLQTLKPATLLKNDSSTGVFNSYSSILKNISVRFFLNWLYKVIVWNFFLESRFQNSPDSVIPSWYITRTLSFERRFRMFIINGYYTKSKGLLSLDSFLIKFQASGLQLY